MDPRVTWAIAHIRQHLADPVSIPQLAAHVNLSTSRFAHLFRREVGVSPAKFLRAVRMARARLLLERTFLTVKEVMVLVGCSDPSHFSRDFREAHGMAPQHWRIAYGERRGTHADVAAGVAADASRSAAVSAAAETANVRQKTPTNGKRPREPGLLRYQGSDDCSFTN
jgi:AraC-like DNA-binding protein